ncbi:MAG TPA: hypothetical protein DCG79_01005 [Clostridiales bacterium]|nr:hypothetical protein [Clostridiales bacterium]
MRKILTSLLIVAILATSVVCCVACQKDKAFEGSAFDAFKALKDAGTIEMEYTESAEYGAWISKITYDGLVMGDAGYPMIYVNNRKYRDELQGMGNDYTYNGEEFYASNVGVSSIVFEEGMKILVVYTEEVEPGTYTYAVKKGPALLFTLPNGVEKTTID